MDFDNTGQQRTDGSIKMTQISVRCKSKVTSSTTQNVKIIADKPSNRNVLYLEDFNDHEYFINIILHY